MKIFCVCPTGDQVTHQIGEFAWSWSGHGVTEHWFDDSATKLKVVDSYESQSGLTADDTHIVAYKRHVRVKSFYKGEKPEIDSYISAEFVSYPTNYRANWTGFAISQNYVGELNMVIRAELGEYGKIPLSTCRHNPTVQVKIVSLPEKKSYHLCKYCRMKGIRWEEFSKKNQKDICPYFRRACQCFTEKSDKFPDWFYWRDNNLLLRRRHLSEDGEEVYEVVFLRERDGFVRRKILLFRSYVVFIFPYLGYIPNSMEKFLEKYKMEMGHRYERE